MEEVCAGSQGTQRTVGPEEHSEVLVHFLQLMALFRMSLCIYYSWGTWWRSWLRHCATSWKVAGSIPDGAIGIYFDIILLAALWSWGRLIL